MKIKRFKIIKSEQRPLLDGLELRFEDCSEINCNKPNCFIGVNGSGKSQYLESIAEAFLYLDRIFRKINKKDLTKAPLTFELEYSIIKNGKSINVDFHQKSEKRKDLDIYITRQDDSPIEFNEDEISDYLPEKIVGYTSGENETLSMPFYSYFDEYAEHTASRALKKNEESDYEPRFYFMDYSTNLGIIISNLIFEKEAEISIIKKELKLDSLKSFQIKIQTKQSAAPKIKVNGKTGVFLTIDLKNWEQELINCATCVDYDRKTECYTLDYYLNDATQKALTDFFKTPHNLYTALYKFELLNNLIVDKKTRESIERKRLQRKLTTKMPTVPDKDKVLNYSELKLKLENGQIIDYLNMSDGEHQYFNIFGTLLMMDQPNTLFLLDEPETHFNPTWRRYFVSTLKKIISGKSQDVFVTSHSPFIVSDTPSENVYIFKRLDKDKIDVFPPSQETYGSSFNNILKMAFQLDETISNESLGFINDLLKEKDPVILKSKIQQLGDSPLLLSLYSRLNTLQNNQ